MADSNRKIKPLNPTSASVGLSTGLVIAFRYERTGCVFTNISENFITLRLDGTAAVNMYSGITLVPGGGTWTMDQFTLTNDPVYAKASGAGSTLTIQEFIG